VTSNARAPRPESTPTDDDSNERAMTQRIFRAMMLAPTVEICDALIKGEHVPIEQLDAEWVERFGRRPR
jgi:hypothetical protein